MEDMHIHVRNGVENYETLKQYVSACINNDIKRVLFLEHGPRISEKHSSRLDSVEKIRHLKQNIEIARKEFPDIKIYFGIELDFSYDKKFQQKNLDLLKANFDYVIGAIHSMRFYNGRDYLETVIDMLNSYPIDIIGHMLLKYDWMDCKDLIDNVLSIAREKEIMIEINTSDRSRWDDEILKYMLLEMKKKDVKFTIASDAHYLNEIGHMIKETTQKVRTFNGNK